MAQDKDTAKLLRKIKREYIRSDTLTYPKLAEKYGISYDSLAKIGAREHWKELRQERRKKQADMAVDDIAESNSRVDGKLDICREMLVDMLMESIAVMKERGSSVSPRTIRDYAAAMKDLKSLNPSDLDIEEKKARIESLRARSAEPEDAGPARIEIEGWDEAWAK